MKKISVFITIFTIKCLTIFSQPTVPNEDAIINPFWNFYADNYLSSVSAGRGFTGIGYTGDISSSILNPASFDIEGKYQAEVQYTYKTTQPWPIPPGTDKLNLKQNLFSLSAGFGVKINKHIQVGFIYDNPSTFTLDLGQIIRTDEFGNEIGRYDGYERMTQHSFSIPFVYISDKLRLGASVNFSMYRNYSNALIGQSNGQTIQGYTEATNRLNGQIGLLYSPFKEFSIGASFIPKSTGNITYDITNTGAAPVATRPMKIGSGASYGIIGSGLRLFADYTYTNTSVLADFKDQQQVHVGAEYQVNKILILRGGVFNYPDPRDLSTGHWGNPQDDYNQVFLTLGASYKVKNLSVNLAILDSHVSSGVIKNTYVNAGVVYNFMK